MVQLMESDIKNQRFILSASDVSYRQIISMIAQSFNKKQPFFKLYPWMGELGWRMEKLKLLIGKRPTYSRQIAESAFHEFHYSNQKITAALNYQFIPIKKSIEETASIFLQEMNAKTRK
jgi:nucleoside-diphosphate-sugar epimerase